MYSIIIYYYMHLLHHTQIKLSNKCMRELWTGWQGWKGEAGEKILVQLTWTCATNLSVGTSSHPVPPTHCSLTHSLHPSTLSQLLQLSLGHLSKISVHSYSSIISRYPITHVNHLEFRMHHPIPLTTQVCNMLSLSLNWVKTNDLSKITGVIKKKNKLSQRA